MIEFYEGEALIEVETSLALKCLSLIRLRRS